MKRAAKDTEEKAGSNSLGIVTSDNVASARRAPHRIVFFIAALLLAWLVFIVVRFSISEHHESAKKVSSESSQEEKSAQQRFKETYSEKQERLEAQLSVAKTDAKKSAAYIDLANLASAKGEQDAAYNYARKAYESAVSIDSCIAYATWAEQRKEYTTAANLYGQAAKIAGAQKNPDANIAKVRYEAAQKRLEAMK